VSLKTQVEAYVGTVDAVQLSSWLAAIARTLLSVLPGAKLHGLATSLAVDANTDATSVRVLSVAYGGKTAREVAPEIFRRSAPGSIHEATKEDPIYCLRDGKIEAKGGDADAAISADVVTLPQAVDTDGDAITGLPKELTHAAVLWAALQALPKRLSDIALEKLGALSITLPDPPQSPASLSYTYTSPELGEFANTVIDEVGSAPLVNASLVAPPDVTLAPLEVPEAPSAPGFTATDINGEIILALATGMNLDVSAQLAQAAAYLDTDQDIELGMAKLAEVRERISQFQANVQALSGSSLDAARAANDVEKFNAAQAFDAQVKQYSSALQLFSEKIQLYVEQARSAREEKALSLQAWSQNAQVSIQAEQQRYTAEFNALRAAQEKALQQAQLDQQRLAAIYKTSTDVTIKNEAMKFDAAVKAFSSDLELYGQGLAGYRARVETQIQAVASAVQQYTQQADIIAKQMEMLQRQYNAEMAMYFPPAQKE
jgi:hypothetical protein